MHTIRQHDVNLHSNHRVLRDMSQDMAQGLTGPVGEEVDVFVGVHAFKDAPPDTGRLRIGIQTEQILDHTGKTMWSPPSAGRLQRLAQDYDLLLDLSPSNQPAYSRLAPELSAKVRFGPHIFPAFPVVPVIGTEPPLFFGRMAGRRGRVIAELQQRRPITVARHGTFGRGLVRMAPPHCAVLNIHFGEGEYVEYPRLLKSYLFGKPFISETLAPPLFPGVHYYTLEDEVTEARTRAIFANLVAFAAAHSLQTFLETAVQRWKMPQAQP